MGVSAALTAVGSLIYILGPTEDLALPFRAKYTKHLILVRTHALGAALTLLLGPLQLRRLSNPKISQTGHRLLGYLYLVGLAVGSVTALPMSLMALGGPVSKVGFLLLSCLWLYTGIRVLHTAWNRDFREHELWVVRSFALAFGAVALRVYLQIAEVLGAGFYSVYPSSVWVAWIPCLLMGEVMVQRLKSPES